jgi:hypothetical protein
VCIHLHRVRRQRSAHSVDQSAQRKRHRQRQCLQRRGKLRRRR